MTRLFVTKTMKTLSGHSSTQVWLLRNFFSFSMTDSLISEMQDLLGKGHFYMLDSIDSEDIAQMIHLFLTFTPY